jgi:hypothetical protein
VALRELFAVFGVDFETGPMNRGAASVEGMFSRLQEFGGLVASAWITRGVYDLAAGVADFADELTDAGTAIGMNANELLAWRTVAAGAGVAGEQLRTVFGALSRNVDAANTGNRDLAKTFADLGVALENGGVPRETGDILADTATAIAQIQDPTERTATAMRLLGEQGARLLPAFADGAEGLEAMRAEVDALFGGSLEEAAEQADALELATAKWDLSIQALKTTVGLELLPKLNEMLAYGVSLFQGFQRLAAGTNVVKIGMTLMGIAGAAAAVKMIIPFLPAIATFALVAAAVAVAVVVIDDLIAMFTGGRSVIAGFIDETYGVGTASAVVFDLKEAWAGLNLAMSDGWQWATDLLGPVGRDIAAFAEWADKVNLLTNMLEVLKEVASGIGDFIEPVASFFETPFARAAREAQEREEAARPTSERARGTRPRDAGAWTWSDFGNSRVRNGTAPAPGPAGRTNVSQSVVQNNPVTIQIMSTDPDAIASEVETRIQRSNDRQLTDAREALMSTAD